jgi:hypothetical protein
MNSRIQFKSQGHLRKIRSEDLIQKDSRKTEKPESERHYSDTIDSREVEK